MPKPFPFGRVIAGVLAAAFFGFGLFCLCGAWSIRSEYDRKGDERPMDVPVDLSKPGEFSVALHQSWSVCHGQTTQLEVPPEVLAKTSPAELLASLNMQWQIVDSAGEVQSDGEFVFDPENNRDAGDQRITLMYYNSLRRGDYQFKCRVIHGAPALAGVDQRLVCQYQPCGMELLGAVVFAAIGVGSLVVGGVIVLVIRAVGRRKAGRRDADDREGEWRSPGTNG